MFDTLSTRIKAYGAYRQTRRELNALSNRGLEDIGLTRGTIDAVARGRRG